MDGDRQRHFPDWSELDPGLAGSGQALIARLLEDGHGEDLRWLSKHCSESELADFLRRRGGRQLSRRSRAFWAVVLGVPEPAAPSLARDLWPL